MIMYIASLNKTTLSNSITQKSIKKSNEILLGYSIHNKRRVFLTESNEVMRVL